MANANTITIDWNKVDRLLECGNDGIRVAANLGVHPNTLYNACVRDKGVSFCDYLAEKRQRGVSHLLAKQYEVAMKGNTTMLIWVGKQMAGQTDSDKNKESVNEKLLTDLINGLKSNNTTNNAQQQTEDIVSGSEQTF